MKSTHQLGPPLALAVACPKCGAPAGRSCQSPAAPHLSTTHKARRVAYEIKSHAPEIRVDPAA